LVQAPLSHVTSSSHSPLAEQVCTPRPPAEHWVSPGAHVPVQPTPATHACLVQEAGGPQLPVASQISRPSVVHSTASLAHTPLQTPLTQVCMPQSAAAPQWPVLLQVCTPLPEHWMAPGEQGAPASPPPPDASSPVAPASVALSDVAWSTVASPSVPPDDAPLPLSAPGFPASCPLVEVEPAQATRTAPAKRRLEAIR
jgi:hypothetical protein